MGAPVFGHAWDHMQSSAVASAAVSTLVP
jgi:hypothetical protein